MTWLLVITSPSDVMIMPVPWSSLDPDLTSMETTAWMTLSTSCGMVTLPLSTAAPGAALLSWMVTPPELVAPVPDTATPTPAPMPAPITAATMATGNQIRMPPPRVPPAEDAAGGVGGGEVKGTAAGGAGDR